MALYDEICEALKQDSELATMIKSQLTEECYPDPEFKTMTLTFGFYISRFYAEEKQKTPEEEWFPSDYSPNISVEKWVEFLDRATAEYTGALTAETNRAIAIMRKNYAPNISSNFGIITVAALKHLYTHYEASGGRGSLKSSWASLTVVRLLMEHPDKDLSPEKAPPPGKDPSPEKAQSSEKEQSSEKDPPARPRRRRPPRNLPDGQ